MPVTAKLSRQFYDKLGDEVANELVEWQNQVNPIGGSWNSRRNSTAASIGFGARWCPSRPN